MDLLNCGDEFNLKIKQLVILNKEVFHTHLKFIWIEKVLLYSLKTYELILGELFDFWQNYQYTWQSNAISYFYVPNTNELCLYVMRLSQTGPCQICIWSQTSFHLIMCFSTRSCYTVVSLYCEILMKLSSHDRLIDQLGLDRWWRRPEFKLN